MEKVINLKKNAILNGLRTILNMLFPLITFPYVSRVLTVDEIGKYNFSQSIIAYFLLIAALGIDKFAIREGTKYRDQPKEFSEFASEVFSVNIISTILSYLLLIIYLLYSDTAFEYRFCILIFSVQIFFTTLGMEWVYSIFEEYTYITVRSILFKILSIVLLFCLVRHEGDYLVYAGITVFASVGSNILNLINIRKYCRIHFTFKFKWTKMIRPILIIFASNIAIQIYVNSDITMLGYLTNDYVVGIYSVSTKIYSIVKNVLGAVLIVTIPRFAFYIGKNLRINYEELLKKVVNTLVLLGVPIVVGLIILSKNIILIMASDKYLRAQISLIILCVAILFSIFSTIFNQCVLLPNKREKVFLKSSIVSALLNVCLNLIFIPYIGEVGAALTTLLSEAMMTIINFLGCKDLVGNLIFDKEFFTNLFSTIIGSIAIVFVCIVSKNMMQDIYIQTCVAILGSIALYILLLVVLRNKIVLEYVNGLKNGIF